jgi:stress-induced morphogen
VRVGNRVLARPFEHDDELPGIGADEWCRPTRDVTAPTQGREILAQDRSQSVLLSRARPVCGKRDLSRHASIVAATIGAMATEPLQRLLKDAFPDATELRVEDRTGGGDHFQVTVATPRFDGLPLLEQHRLVNAALAEPLRNGTIHELRIKTKGTE